jgi:acetyltransferase-like isoleucine patch superfamily enzyme
LVSLFPGVCGQYVRRAFLAWTIGECHPSATICFGAIFSKSAARVGANVYVGPCCTLGSVTIERDTLIATGVHVLSGSRMHGISDPTRPIREQPGEFMHVTIGAGCWIGAGAIIMADIGANSVIGAGAVVTNPIPDGVIAAGVPARVIRVRFNDQTELPGE